MKGIKCYLIVFQHSKRLVYELSKFDLHIPCGYSIFEDEKPITLVAKLRTKSFFLFRRKNGREAWNKFLDKLKLR